MLSLTAHAVNFNFERINLVLGAISLHDRHTVEYISKKFEEMLEKWDIKNDEIHCVMWDSGTNMEKSPLLDWIKKFRLLCT